MSFANWKLKPSTVFSASAVIPVLTIHDLKHAIPLATALIEGGINILEITLRSSIALTVIQTLVKAFPSALIGAGTVANPNQLLQAIEAGAKFAISPGQTQALLLAGHDSTIPLIPGVSTVSELMGCLSLGYTHFKLFPAEIVGGVGLLKAMYGPFPQAHFCPTGGINPNNYSNYLALPNVSCVGGSWLASEETLVKQDWPLITTLAKSVQHNKHNCL